MILYFDSYITDIPLNKNFVDPIKWIRQSCPNYAMPSKVDIAKYTLASYAEYPWSHVLVRYVVVDETRKEEFVSYVKSLFPKAVLIEGSSMTQAEYRKSLAILDAWDDDWIWYAPNNDHPIMTHDLSIIDRVLAKAETFTTEYPHISIPYSHFSEYQNLTRKGSPFWELFGQGTSIIEEDEDTLCYTIAEGDNTAIQIVNKNLFRTWFDSIDMGDDRIIRSEDVRRHFFVKNQLQVLPKQEIAAHFDGYAHTMRGLAEINPHQVPPLFIPSGFFTNTIRIKYGFPTYDPQYTNVNPAAAAYAFADARHGTDLKTTLDHLPLFWKKRTSETAINPKISETTLTAAYQRNQDIIRHPYYLKNKQTLNQTIDALFLATRLRLPKKVAFEGRRKKDSLLRKAYTLLRLHPTSTPYLSGDTFRSLADHIIDRRSTCAPTSIKQQQVVFVESSHLKTFIQDTHPLVTHPYILLTQNGDENIDTTYQAFIDSPTLIHWFAQNCQISHKKVTPLPIGLENEWLHLHGKTTYFNQLRQTTTQTEKKDFILYKFNVATNPKERGVAKNILDQHPLTTTYPEWRESMDYLSVLNQYKFVASPPGNGEDCIRTWEAMYLRTIPIIKRSTMANYYQAIGLPVWVIESWDELKNLTKKDLIRMYTEMSAKFDHPALWLPYWQEKIDSLRS